MPVRKAHASLIDEIQHNQTEGVAVVACAGPCVHPRGAPASTTARVKDAPTALSDRPTQYSDAMGNRGSG